MSRELHQPRSMAAPSHPGLLLRNRVLPALGMTISRAALDLATTRQTLHRIFTGRSAITPDMAVRLEHFCGISATYWLERQQEYDLSQARAVLVGPLARLPQHFLPTAILERIGASHEQ